MPDPDAPKKKTLPIKQTTPSIPAPGSVDWANLTFGTPGETPVLSTPGTHAQAIAAAVPASVDEYQKNIEAPRAAIPKTPIVPAPVVPPVSPPSALIPPITPEQPINGLAPTEKTAADGAQEIANAPKNRVDDVINKLKEEEKKGGPNFFDILEAAAAGWQGKTPIYVEKKMQKAAQEAEAEKEAKRQAFEREQMAEQARLQDEELTRRFAEERSLRGEDIALAREELAKEIASREKIAGMSAKSPIPGVAKIGPLDIAELGVGR